MSQVEDVQQDEQEENIVERGQRRRQRGQQADLPGPDRASSASHPAAAPASAPEKSSAGKPRPRLPAGIENRFIEVEARGDFYFQDRTPAFSYRDGTMKTRSTSIEVVQAFVEIAKHEDWDTIKATGTKDFRQAVYLEAAKLGIEVTGYTPTEVEKAQAERDMKRYYRDRENTVENRSRETPAPEQAAPAAPPAPPTQEAQAQVKAPEAEQAAPASTPATAQEAPQAQSPAKAPEKAPEHVQTQQPAQQAAVQPPGPQKAPDLKEAPQVQAEKAPEGKAPEQRGKRYVEVAKAAMAKLLERAKAFLKNPEQAAKEHPALAPAYGTVLVAEKFAAEKLPPAQAEKFVEAVKKDLAQKIQHGEKVPAPAIKQEAALRLTQAPPEYGILAKALDAQRRLDPVGHEQHRNKVEQAKQELQQGTAFTPKPKATNRIMAHELLQEVFGRVVDLHTDNYNAIIKQARTDSPGSAVALEIVAQAEPERAKRITQYIDQHRESLKAPSSAEKMQQSMQTPQQRLEERIEVRKEKTRVRTQKQEFAR